MFGAVTTILAFTLEKYMAVKDPLKARHYFTKKRKKIVIGKWRFVAIYCSLEPLFTMDFADN